MGRCKMQQIWEGTVEVANLPPKLEKIVRLSGITQLCTCLLYTSRPETMLGDTAVAVHPEDERYKDMVGKMLILPLVGREIPVIADEYVERDFGTGVVKITPAHDPNDFEVGLRHNLEIINVMDDGANMNENAGKYCGMTAQEARKKIVEELKEQGFLIKVEPIKHNVGSITVLQR